MAKKNIAANLRKRNLQNSKNLAIKKKGMELPINTLVVVAIAVIVILAIAAFFMGGFGGSSKLIQNQQDFKNSCSAWTQTGCAGSAPIGLDEKFLKWQPDKQDELNGMSENDKTDYLAGMCGCFGRGSPGRTGGTCSDYTVLNCPTGATDKCKLKYTTCLGLGSGLPAFGCGSSCSGATWSGEASNSPNNYGCTTSPNLKCCIPVGKTEPTNLCVLK